MTLAATDFGGRCCSRAIFFQKIIHEQRNVVGTLAQRRNRNAHDVEAVKQILAELFGGDGGFERLVRRGDDAHVHLDRLVAADALERAALQHAQNFRLRRGRHVADFVEENRAVVALLEFADALVRRAGERAAFVAEQFAFQKLFGNGGAIDGEERLLRCGRCDDKSRGRRVPCPCRFRR